MVKELVQKYVEEHRNDIQEYRIESSSDWTEITFYGIHNNNASVRIPFPNLKYLDQHLVELLRRLNLVLFERIRQRISDFVASNRFKISTFDLIVDENDRFMTVQLILSEHRAIDFRVERTETDIVGHFLQPILDNLNSSRQIESRIFVKLLETLRELKLALRIEYSVPGQCYDIFVGGRYIGDIPEYYDNDQVAREIELIIIKVRGHINANPRVSFAVSHEQVGRGHGGFLPSLLGGQQAAP